MTDLSIAPIKLDVFHLEAPLKTPRRNAFGTMHARPALLVRLTDASGHEGWGEVFCNWPAFAASHRKKIMEQILAPKMIGQVFSSPSDLWHQLTRQTHALVIQANEPGPFEQCIGGLDIAAWDLVSRRTERPLYDVLAPGQNHAVPAYASALTSETLDRFVPALKNNGWQGFKVKVGFGADADRGAVGKLRDFVGEAAIMVDANQAWTPESAVSAGVNLAGFDLLWMEEPIAADRSQHDWTHVSHAQPIPLAAGENLRGLAAFEAAAVTGGVRILQPDAIKWGGLTGLLKVSAIAAKAGVAFAPHFLGSGMGLVATAHAAIATQAAWLEVDVTENPLRTVFSDNTLLVEEGLVKLSDQPGLGVTPSLEQLSAFQVGG